MVSSLEVLILLELLLLLLLGRWSVTHIMVHHLLLGLAFAATWRPPAVIRLSVATFRPTRSLPSTVASPMRDLITGIILKEHP